MQKKVKRTGLKMTQPLAYLIGSCSLSASLCSSLSLLASTSASRCVETSQSVSSRKEQSFASSRWLSPRVSRSLTTSRSDLSASNSLMITTVNLAKVVLKKRVARSKARTVSTKCTQRSMPTPLSAETIGTSRGMAAPRANN